MGGDMTLVWEMGEVHTVLVVKPDGKRPLERLRRRREENIKMDLFKEWDGVAWTGLIWLRIGTGSGSL
jgi:hypothetical protein